MVLDIVNWEHRHKTGKLLSGGWCIDRIRQLMHYSEEGIRQQWLDVSGEPYFFEAIGKEKVDGSERSSD
jgi:hypothetical protein